MNNWQMYFNLGNAYLQNGSLGQAIVNYQRAAALTNDKAVHANLEHAKLLVKTEVPVAKSQTTLEIAKEQLAAIPLQLLSLVAVRTRGSL